MDLKYFIIIQVIKVQAHFRGQGFAKIDFDVSVCTHIYWYIV